MSHIQDVADSSVLDRVAADGDTEALFFNIGRAVAGFGPLAVGALSASYGFETAIALLALLYLVDIAALLLLVPERNSSEQVG